jgi:hypothetical protein
MKSPHDRPIEPWQGLELDLLDLLRSVMDTASSALLHADPGIWADEIHSWIEIPQTTIIARKVLRLMHSLDSILVRFKEASLDQMALTRKQQHDDQLEIPF